MTALVAAVVAISAGLVRALVAIAVTGSGVGGCGTGECGQRQRRQRACDGNFG